jgi:hypothetical protein
MANAEAEAKALTRALLAARKPGATICPSEVARQLADTRGQSGWRELMPAVHAAVDALMAEGELALTWKGKPLGGRAGPYRIGKACG